MKILDRYIFKEILFPSLIALVALTFVAFLAFSREIGWLLELIVRQSATTSGNLGTLGRHTYPTS